MKREDALYHIQLRRGDIGRYVLLPGDPGRCERIARYFDAPNFVASNREYCTWTGSLLGEKVSVTSTGIGCPSTAIAVEELIMIGADTFIRVGTAGGIQPENKAGDVAVITGAIRDEGTTPQYLPVEYPALADIDVVCALRDAANRLGLRYHLGVAHSKDSFYGEVQMQRMPVAARLQERWRAWKAGGAIASEMESSALFILASIHRKRAGGVMLLIGDPAEPMHASDAQAHNRMLEEDRQIRVAIEAIKLLIE
ncbi:MAG: uridine phosphorylase, partial [Anaerolineaceae bacterium]|nr:uridine phosphorylase [Anaerolineaceae bacterium]